MNAAIEAQKHKCIGEPTVFMADAMERLDAGEPNHWITYFVGYLAESRFPERERPKLNSLARALYASAERGQVVLAQHRISDYLYEYRAKRLC